MFEKSPSSINRFKILLAGAAVGVLGLSALPTGANAAIMCNRTLTADVVAFDMPLMFNRLGAQNINGMMFALRRDVVDTGSLMPIGGGGSPGEVTLRPDKRPRPLVLRMGAGDCLTYTVTNLLTPAANPFNQPEVRSGISFELDINDQVADRRISLRFQGTELVDSIAQGAEGLIEAEGNPHDTWQKVITGNSADMETIAQVRATLDHQEREQVQLIMMHPPYHDIIKFSDNPYHFTGPLGDRHTTVKPRV